MTLTYGQRISPYAVWMEGVGHFKSPKLSDIFNPNVGDGVYYSFLCLLSNNPKVILKLIGKELELPEPMVKSIKTFDLWSVLSDHYVQMLLSALSFFVDETVLFDRSLNQITLMDGENQVGIINRDNFGDVCDIIKQLNVISRKEVEQRETLRFRNEAAKKLYEQLHADDTDNKDDNSDMEISNLISAVVSRSHTYNYENVWNLTVCQLYDVFFRENNNVVIDAAIMRWCIWGKDECECFDKWFKSIDLKEEK